MSWLGSLNGLKEKSRERETGKEHGLVMMMPLLCGRLLFNIGHETNEPRRRGKSNPRGRTCLPRGEVEKNDDHGAEG
jgi:hypothetical protein